MPGNDQHQHTNMHQMPMSSIMYMDGFHFTYFSPSPNQPCLNLFLSSWTLDTPEKFIIATFGVFSLGVLTEGVGSYVRHRRFRPPAPHTFSGYINAVVHIFQALLAYVDMLVVMTLSIELFLSLLAGFGLGFFVFSNIRSSELDYPTGPGNKDISTNVATTRMARSADIPCCEFLSYEEPTHLISTQHELEGEEDDMKPTTPLLAAKF